MDRRRPVYERQKSIETPTKGASSPMASPLHRHARSGSSGLANMRKPQNTAAKAAAQRLAQVMSQSPDDEEDEDDDLMYDYAPASASVGLGLGGGRGTRPRPSSVRTSVDNTSASSLSSARTTSSVDQQLPTSQRTPMSVQTSFSRSVFSGRPSQPNNLAEQVQPPSARSTSTGRSSQYMSSIEQVQPPSARSSSSGRTSLQYSDSTEQVQPSSARSSGRSSQQYTSSMDQVQPQSARSTSVGRSSQYTNSNEQIQSSSASRSPVTSTMEQPLSARATTTSRPNLGVKALPMVPPVVPIKLRPQASLISADVASDNRKENRRLSVDMGSMNLRESSARRSTSDLQDELDMLQEENDGLLEKLRLADERIEEAEARARQLEKQIANIGDGVSLEARLLSKKEAALQQREAALKVATQTYGSRGEEVQTLRMEAEIARDEATAALENLHDIEKENKALRVMTQRLILTQEEMEEVVLKRCWLARYWKLCIRHAIHAEIATARYEYWSSFAPLPVEVVLAAGQKSKKDGMTENHGAEERQKALHDLKELSGEGNVESMLLVEKGLRELASLKIEEAVAVAFARLRRSNSTKTGLSEDLKLPFEGHNFAEAFELSDEESEDVLFKQAWLTYFWRRAKKHGVEADIADERLQFWINHDSQSPTSNDAIDVERGLFELRKLGVEIQLWEESRRLADLEFSNKLPVHSDF